MQAPGLDAVLNLLAAGARREIVHALRQQAAGEATIDELVELLATDGLVTARERERLAINLYHAHLPKLDDHGLVEFDPEGGTVRYQPNEAIERVIDSIPDPGRTSVESGSAD